MSAKTWIDLTDMVSWSGHHGGTQRVVYGIANEYYIGRGTNTGFCVFNEADERFYEYDFSILRDRALKAASQHDGSMDSLSRHQQLKEAIVDRVPSFIIENKTLRKSGKHLLKAGVFVVTGAKRQAARTKDSIKKRTIGSSASHPVNLQAGDTLLLLGKPWDTPRMVPAIAKQKERTKFKVGAVIYDMVIPLYPHLHAKTLFKPYVQCMFELMQTADRLFPISVSTKNDTETFCKRLNLVCPPQTVIRLSDALENIDATRKPTHPIADEFILCVGTIEVRKNHTLLYYTYKLAMERNIELPQLIIVGKSGWDATDIYHLMKTDAGIRDKIVILKSVADSELAWLYKNCLFTVYPSMYEGWGLPVAESLQYGKAAAVSTASSIPEIGGDILSYFSPYSTDECLERITDYLIPENREAAEQIIRKKYTSTQWATTYKQLLTGLKEGL